MTSTYYKAPAVVIEKLNRLFGILQEAKLTFEQVALSLKNKQVHETVISLAQESRQYARELGAQIISLGGNLHKLYTEHELDNKFFLPGEWQILDSEKKTLKVCEKSEKLVLRAYREVLNEPFLIEGIRKMIRYQLNGIMCAFFQLKMLNASLLR